MRHEVFHSILYNRSGKTCSSLVEACNDDNTLLYGTILKFVVVRGTSLALLKILHHHEKSICAEGPTPSRSLLRRMARDSVLADFLKNWRK